MACIFYYMRKASETFRIQLHYSVMQEAENGKACFLSRFNIKQLFKFSGKE